MTPQTPKLRTRSNWPNNPKADKKWTIVFVVIYIVIAVIWAVKNS